MSEATVLAGTWSDGLHVIAGAMRQQEQAGQSVRSLVDAGDGDVLAIIGKHELARRLSDGTWSTLATSQAQLACCTLVNDTVYVGTDDAQMLRLTSQGQFERLTGFDAVEGRADWYAGTALIDGRVVGPPLGVRSLCANADASALFANVHVGGIPRSSNGGLTWEPTIAVDADVHEVRAHPGDPDVIAAASALGLCVSYDRGTNWNIYAEGLHAPYCSAVMFSGDDVLVAAAAHHFAPEAAVYRFPLDSRGPLQLLRSGLPAWIEGIADTGCMASKEGLHALCDRGGNLYLSLEGGERWTLASSGLPATSCLLLI